MWSRKDSFKVVSLKDISARCGVSVATVSKALNNQQDISIETRERIQSVAAEMGYMANAAARMLKTNRSYNIGVLFVDRRSSGLAHEFFSTVLDSVRVEAERKGYDITFINENVGHQKSSYLQHCLYRGVDGVVIASVDFEDPMVVELTTVTKNRLTGFYRACESAGVRIREDYVRFSDYHDSESCYRLTKELLSGSDRPTCIFFPDDFSCIGGLNAIHDAGLRVPDDISVCGYDGIALSQILSPKLTTWKQNTGELGTLSASCLIDLIEHPKTALIDRRIVSGSLLEGETVADLR